jgi:hypothetical protein
MHGVEHDLEGAVHDHVEVFGVEGSGQLGRALHVDEEDGHLLALAAKRASLGQDPLGQVTRCVGGGRADDGGVDGHRGRAADGQRRAAGVAEARVGTLALAAGRAADLEGGAAPVAEVGALAKILGAGGAVHAGAATITRRGAPCWPGS